MCAGTAIVSTAKVTPVWLASHSSVSCSDSSRPPVSVNTGLEQPLLATTLCAIKFRSKTREEGLCIFAGLFFWLVSTGGGSLPCFSQQLLTAASLLLIPTPSENGHLIGHRVVVIDWLVVSVAILFCSLNSVLSREREADL